jgi:uncharacterized membrane protein
LIAVGAVGRIVLGNLALSSPTPFFGILIKIGLTETLTFVTGFAFGPAIGFLTGALIIIISDMFMLPGAWTPFIAAIIGILGVCAGVFPRFARNPSVKLLGAIAVGLTLISEFLQNTWFALFYNVPIAAAMASGVTSLVTALANNVILFTAIAPRIIKFLREATLRSS